MKLTTTKEQDRFAGVLKQKLRGHSSDSILYAFRKHLSRVSVLLNAIQAIYPALPFRNSAFR